MSMKEMILRDENKRNENEIVVVNVNRLGGNYSSMNEKLFLGYFFLYRKMVLVCDKISIL